MDKGKEERFILAGDIGGTKTILAAYSNVKGLHHPLGEVRYPSADYTDLEAIIKEFIAKYSKWNFIAAVFGVAGPVINGKASITNLPWVMEEEQIQSAFNLEKVKLLNDLESVAYSIPHLQGSELYTLHKGEPVEDGNIAIVAPGTGLGEAFITRYHNQYHIYASEGGHASFGPTDAREVRLLLFLMERYEHVSYERVCSGIGIPNIYAFLKEDAEFKEPEWLAQSLSEAHDPTPVIINAAMDANPQKRAKICEVTLDIFISILGAEAGNLAIKIMATGGIYLEGGIPPRILPALKGGRLLQALHSKGRFSSVLQRIPVHVILNPNAGLLGAASYAMNSIQV